MKILITGGAGYLGSKLIDRLVWYGNVIYVVDNLMHNQGPFVHTLLKHCTTCYDDIMQTPKWMINQADVVFHLAAWVGAPLCDKDHKEAYRVNTEATKWLVDQLSPNQRLIFPCTNSGYGSTGEEICTEETPLNSISVYGKSKEEAEKIVMEHPKATTFRLATVYGLSPRPRIDLMVNYFTYLAACFGKIDVFQGNYRRNFVNINDVIEIFEQVIHNEATYGQVFNLGCDDDNMTKNQLLDVIKAYFKDLEISYSDKEDPDKRDYNVSSAKLGQLGIYARRRVIENLKELDDFYTYALPDDENNIKAMIKFMRNA